MKSPPNYQYTADRFIPAGGGSGQRSQFCPEWSIKNLINNSLQPSRFAGFDNLVQTAIGALIEGWD